jgi:hypothetical protein
MGLLRRWLWWRDKYPSWSFWLGLVTSILLALVLYPVAIVTLCLDLVKLISAQPRPPQPHPNLQPYPHPHPQPRPPQPVPADRKVRIAVLGFPGSGKTVMLAGLYYYFAQGGPTGIRLSANDESNRRLLGLVEQIRTTPGGYFPPGTSVTETRTWSFTVKVESEKRDADAFTLEYLDYAGRLVEELAGTGTDDPPDEEFRRAVDNADILMGVIDGEQLAWLTSGSYDPGAVGRIDRLLNVLIRARQRNIHLVVSKWDLLAGVDGGHYTMADVQGRLAMVSPAFRNFQGNPRLGKLRLIPVSALGMNGFAVPAGAGGGMRRNPGVEWSPWNVEGPFFCAVPDIIRHDLDMAQAEAVGSLGHADTVRSFARITLAVLAASGVSFKLGVGGLLTLDFPVSEAAQRIRQQLGHKYPQGSVPARLDEGTAIGYVANECYEWVEDFEGRHRDCRLGPQGTW